MTREEAIWQIENRWDIMDYRESEALGEALDMAIEALQSEETIEIKPMEIKGDFRIDDCIYCSPKIVGNVEVVVRCKDCRHHGMRDCPVWGDDTTEDYMWCYYGERKEL